MSVLTAHIHDRVRRISSIIITVGIVSGIGDYIESGQNEHPSLARL